MRSPYTPVVGLEPNFLAGRESVIDEYNQRLAKPAPYGKNMVISGLRGA
jgi:hypothetical protein